MALTTCRECGAEVSDQARTCLRCGAPQPAIPAWSGTGFEWKSSRTYGGYPLVHIAFGRDSRGKLRVAKGVIAIGQFALGLITVAQFGVGLLFGSDRAALAKLPPVQRLVLTAGRWSQLLRHIGLMRRLSKLWMPIASDVVIIGGEECGRTGIPAGRSPPVARF